MQTHLCKIPKPSWKQEKEHFKREWHRKASAQKPWPYIAEPKLTPILQLIGKAKFHPDPSPNKWLYGTAACPPQTDRGSSASLKQVIRTWYRQF